MATVTIPGFIFLYPPLYQGDKPSYSFFSFDASPQGYVLVAPHTVEVELPADFNPVAAEVAALQAKKAKALEDYQERVKSINEQLSKLQCLEAV